MPDDHPHFEFRVRCTTAAAKQLVGTPTKDIEEYVARMCAAFEAGLREYIAERAAS